MPYWQKYSYFPFGIFFISVCVIIALQAILVGFKYEYNKFYQVVITITCLLLFQYVVLEHLGYFIHALILTAVKKLRAFTVKIYHTLLFTPKDGSSDYKYNELAFWRMRLQFFKSHLELHYQHKNEPLNWEYKAITQELWMFFKYYVLLIIIIDGFRNRYLYYNTRTIETVFNEYRASSFGLNKVQTVYDVYDYVNTSLVQPFSESMHYDFSEGVGWLYYEVSRVIGVVRLQQTRHAYIKSGMRSIYSDDKNYFPGWKNFSNEVYYEDIFWRVYHPWQSKSYGDFNTWLFGQKHYGSLYTYWDNEAYTSFLLRDANNSHKLLTFLKDNNWLDELTVAVFVEFTLYNMDANIFTVGTCLLEQSPFGMIIWDIRITSAQLISNINDISVWWWLVIFLYGLQTIQFAKALVLKAWYDHQFVKSVWNWLDLMIILLNILAALVVVLRNHAVVYALEICEATKPLEYINFSLALFLDYTLIIIQAFLVTISTIRIWRILQFSRTFRLFTATLYLAATPLVISIICISAFFIGISLSTEIINGSYSENFARFFTSMTSIMSFSFGFNKYVTPDDVSHNGKILGFLLYIIVMFAVAVILINLFISLIMDRFEEAREGRDYQRRYNKLTYAEFLYAEAPYLRYHCKKCSLYHRNISQENIKRNNIDIHLLRMEHTQDIAETLRTQMEILDIIAKDVHIEPDVQKEIKKVKLHMKSKNLVVKLKVFANFQLFINFCATNRIIFFSFSTYNI